MKAMISKVDEERAADLLPRLGGAFFKARGALPAFLRKELEAKSLAPRHVQAMNVIAMAGRVTTGELAERLDVGIPATSQIISELENADWLVRQQDDSDRRRYWISISPDRREELEAYCRKRVTPLLTVLASLSTSDRIVFLDALEQFAAEIELQTKEVK